MLHPFTRQLAHASELIAHAGTGVAYNTLGDLTDLARHHDLNTAEAWLAGLTLRLDQHTATTTDLVSAIDHVLEAAGPYRHPAAVDFAILTALGEYPSEKRRHMAAALAGHRRDELLILNIVRTEVDGIRRDPRDSLRRDSLLADLEVMAAA